MSLDKSAHSKFLEFHSYPKELSPKDLESLGQLIQKFPYCQSIKMLALKSAENTNRYNVLLQEASAFSSSRSILYDFIHQPELFIADLDMAKPSQDEHDNDLFESNNAFGINLNEIVGSEWHEEKIIEQPEEAEEKITNAFGIDLIEILGSEFQEKKSAEQPQDLEIETETVHEEEELVLETEVIKNEIVSEEHDLLKAEIEKTEGSEIASSNEQSEVPLEEVVSEEVAKEQTEELESKVKTEEVTAESEKVIVAQEYIEFEVTAENEAKSASEKEIDIENITPISEESLVETEGGEIAAEQIKKTILEEVENEVTTQDEALEGEQTELETAIEERKEKSVKKPSEELAFERPLDSDFLIFSDNENSKKVKKQKEEVAAYNDDTMPYTFLWWLNKTRKEYAESHQPFVKSKSSSIKLDTQQEIRKQEKDDLNHQIAENIFHLRGVEEFTANSSRTPTVPFEFLRKDFQIIEKFIKEEPQIRPQAPNKIDTENKAKKSSEDSNEVVSETLAKIYVEQMLYHKALDVYKKLSLKFPEKSAYFASQIKYLELKVN